MYRVYLLVCVLGLVSCAGEKGCEEVIIPADFDAQLEQKFDSTYAASLGADEYGMHKYVMALLKEGPNRDYDKAYGDSLQAAHMANIGRLAEEGVLVLAGPFLDDGELKGIYIFDVETIEEARALTESDPAVQAGSLVMELHPWYGSAATMAINEIHEKIAKIKF
ncbi:MAG: YciI family protein [Crocinitomicaceae bacterium]|nr:YciI family protein [Crocinitomicaceae bacterium]